MQYQQNKPRQIPKIIMFEADSSNIKAVGYDKASLTLRIQFKSSNVLYDYLGVSPELYLQFVESDSKGRFFFTQIKGKFQAEKI